MTSIAAGRRCPGVAVDFNHQYLGYVGWDAFNTGHQGGFFYEPGGFNDPIQVNMVSGATMFGASFQAANGWGQSIINITIAEYNQSSLVGIFSIVQPTGNFVTFTDASGFTAIDIYATYSAVGTATLANLANVQESLAMDNLAIQTSSSSVPEPASIALLALALVGLGMGRRKKA